MYSRVVSLLFVCVATVAFAADPAPARRETNRSDAAAQAEKRRQHFEKLTPEQKEAKRREFKARLEKRVGELRARQTNGTLTAEESRELARREQLLKRFEQPVKSGSHPPAVPKP